VVIALSIGEMQRGGLTAAVGLCLYQRIITYAGSGIEKLDGDAGKEEALKENNTPTSPFGFVKSA
jgi:hypothetical protein